MQVMQSNKWTFSLKVLVLLIAVGFVASPAIAGDFATTITVGGDARDISHADGIQLQTNAALTLNVSFGQVVALDAAGAQAAAEIFEAADVKVQAFSADGALLNTATDPAVAAPALGTPADGKNFTVGLTDIPATTDKLIIRIEKEKVGAALASVGDDDDANAAGELVVTYLQANPGGDATPPTNLPDVLKIAMVGEPFVEITSASFQIHVLLTEEPMGGLVNDHIEASEADVASVVKLAAPAATTTIGDAGLTARDGETLTGTTLLNTLASWRDGDAHLYLVTLNTKPGDKTVTIKIKNFAGMESPTPGTAQEMYIRAADSSLVEGRDILTVKTKTAATPATPLAAGLKVALQHGDQGSIPANGFYILTKNNGNSGINVPDNAQTADKRTPAELMYNIREQGGLPNLLTFLRNGGTIDLVGPSETAMGSVVITEVMWGEDASLENPAQSQWIEVHNTTASAITIAENAWNFVFYQAHETLPTTGYVDRVSTVPSTGYWSIEGKGNSGRSGITEKPGEIVAPIAAVALTSMQRAANADGMFADGSAASSWSASTPPSLNLDFGKEGSRVATPGAAPAAYPEPPAPPPAPEPAPPATPAATASDIGITEIMVDTGGGRLPQWIELTNLSSAAVSLADWNVVIDNAADADVYGGGAPVTVSIGDVELGVGEGVGNGDGEGQSVLLVAWSSRNSGNFNAGRVVNLATQLEQTGRYQLLSYNGFRITLVPKQTSPVLASGDDVGNLGMDWDIPMGEGGRSSLIRMEMDAAGMATMGTSADGWRLASMTDLIQGPTSWYGSDEDAGTPGYDSGGPLPVELSMFYPKRNDAGQVVITWETQSELNNAGFFIKRSQQRDGKFVVINPTMVPGAGTTSEKQSYTYTDTSAQPNVVYYYQIEDVSLDGQRQTLTLGTRLRGHIGAAGKATTTWGELKAQE